MKKSIYILSATFVLSTMISCGGEEKKQESKKENPKEEVDTISADTLAEEEVIKHRFIEDFATLKTYEEALAYFGDSNMVADTNWYAEGEVMMLSHRCTDPYSRDVIQLVWEQGGKEKLSQVEVYYQIWDNDYSNVISKQRVQSKCGLSTGMSIGELETFCGQPIEFSGFGWDYAGGVRMDGVSKLEACNVNVTLDVDHSDHDKIQHLLGDIPLKSDMEEVKGMPVFVQKLTYYLR